MSIMWMKNHAKWVIILATVLVAFGLIFMDRAGASRQGYGLHGDYIGSVDGEEIPIASFQQEMKTYIRNEEGRTGKAPEGIQLAQMRENLLQYKVQEMLLQKNIRAYRLVASVPEMQDYLLQHPLDVGNSLARFEGPDRVPVFLRDSTLDTLRFRNWLAQDSVYDRLGMRALESQLKNSVIPQLQLQEMLKSQVHRTELEEAFVSEMRESSGRIRFYAVSADSFPVPKEKYAEADLRAHFDAHPDSFFFKEEAASLRYARIPVHPSSHDTALMREFARELKQRAQGGESFADLAKSYSNDPGSADSGGRLGGPQPRGTWVPPFADAAFRLNPGEISDPVLTQYGIHVILLHEKKREKDGVEKAAVSHILLKITAGTETLDSLTDFADHLRDDAEKDGLEAAAKTRGLSVEKTAIFEKGGALPLGGAYLAGVQSFAFSPHEKKAKVSDVLQNEEGLYVFERAAHYPKGRVFERARENIAAALDKSEQMELARREMEKLRPQIVSAGGARVGKAILDSTALIAAETYVPVFGYGSPELLRCFRQKEGEWGPVRVAAHGAVVAKLLQRQTVDENAKIKSARAALAQGDSHLINSLYQQWLSSLPKTAKVENHLDMVYRN